MAIGHRTWPWARRESLGTSFNKNIYTNTYGYTETTKKVAAGTNTAIHAAISGSLSVQNVTTSITDPDVPRALKVVVGGTAGHVNDGDVTITGTNVEGKTITEEFEVSNGVTGTINGSKAFKTVSNIRISAMLGTGCTFSIGTQDKLGINHRLWLNNSTVKVYTQTAAYGALSLQNAPTVVASGVIENNLVTPASAPNGSLIFTICYAYDNWALAPVLDQPEYEITTSTSSTSTSTSTSTITTSTSSTSVSTSSTSSSTSSTSSSTSSTSTSTTTVP